MSADSEAEPASAIKLSDVVYAKIAGLIRSGDYPAHSKLPTENELATILAVSRPIVRDALARLRSDGVVISRRGSGSYVLASDTHPSAPPSVLGSIADLRRLIDYRISLEGESAYHAALGIEDHRDALRTAISRLEKASPSDAADFEDDFDFHRSVAVASGNRFLTAAIDAIREPMLSAMSVTTSFIAPHSHDRLRALPREHRAIFDAIMRNDPGGARSAMRAHLENSKTRVFEGV